MRYHTTSRASLLLSAFYLLRTSSHPFHDFDELPSTPASCSSSAVALGAVSDGIPNTPAATPLVSSTGALDFSTARVTPSEERELELMMQFLGEDFPKQHPSYESSSMTEKSWLMYIFKRSPIFFYASLGTSAYLTFLQAPEYDGRRIESFREYDRYRNIATKNHQTLLEASLERLRPPADFTLGETIICSVQLAILEIVGVERWVFVSLMDAIEASVWKREQESENRLSMRELIAKTDAIVSSIRHQIQQGDHVQTHVFAYAVVIYIHTIASGHLPAVPEIQQTIEKAVLSWQRISPSLNNLKRLSWAFCVSASLATGSQRVIFDNMLSDAASIDPLSRTVICLKSLVEECWKTLDAGAPSFINIYNSVLEKFSYYIINLQNDLYGKSTWNLVLLGQR
ncbi:hypothetical protein Trco_008399 [Trichoderma cornu-damae]|uniref:Transcription factor domain-containing protein n=1 Tax=Trichoderma cornu-damae TaxID=654480 RepID=A0A9P8TU07_9HYPO|nr:hypothetical protein Trco_008399 [Trichoderma cornu-damae]